MFNSSKKKSTICLFIIILIMSFSADLYASSWGESTGLLKKESGKNILKRVVVEQNEKIKIEYQVPQPEFHSINNQSYKGEVTKECILGNAKTGSIPGEPLVPYISPRIILPYGYAVESIKVYPIEKIRLDGEYLLGFGETPQPISSNIIQRTDCDSNIYESNSVYPKKDAELMHIQDRCGVSVATVQVFPLKYYPKSGKIEYYKRFYLEIKTKTIKNDELSQVKNGIRIRKDRFQSDLVSEENLGTLDSYPEGLLLGNSNSVIGETRDQFSYVIVTSSAIINANYTIPNINDFVAHKQKLGLSVKVKNIEEIKATYPGANDFEKLRNFIRDAYNNWNTKYVLLGGDTNIIPLKTVLERDEHIPTDMPYQCLSQTTWNNDYNAEVYIGRASAENATEFSNFVYKTIAYESSTPNDSYLKKALHLGEKLDDRPTYAKECMDAIKSVFTTDYFFHGLFDKISIWDKNALLSKINSNSYSIINHLGHSNPTYNLKLGMSDINSFTNNKYIFVKSQGCLPGAFEQNCIAEAMTTSTRNGMWGVVLNSRYGWYSPTNMLGGSSQIVHKSFWQAYFSSNKKRVGECNEYSHRVNTSQRWDILESNLFGDPSVQISIGHNLPNIAITSPQNGNYYAISDVVEIKVNASGADLNSKVEFYINNTKIYTDYNAPYNYNWSANSSGNKTIKVKAYSSSNVSIEREVNITVHPLTQLEN